MPFEVGVLALGWGFVAAAPLAVRARRAGAAARARGIAPRRAPHSPLHPARGAIRRAVARAAGWRALRAFVSVATVPARLGRARRFDDDVARELAVAVDLVGVGVAAGCTPYLAVELGARWSPPLVAAALDEVLRACSMGQAFDDALRGLGERMPGVRPLADALRTSAQLGTPVAPALARLAIEVRADLRRRAEIRARTVPVRLCFPLVGCILPAFALLTVVPVVLDGIPR
jgi:Flp pilus assembly protein TadB